MYHISKAYSRCYLNAFLWKVVGHNINKVIRLSMKIKLYFLLWWCYIHCSVTILYFQHGITKVNTHWKVKYWWCIPNLCLTLLFRLCTQLGDPVTSVQDYFILIYFEGSGMFIFMFVIKRTFKDILYKILHKPLLHIPKPFTKSTSYVAQKWSQNLQDCITLQKSWDYWR